MKKVYNLKLKLSSLCVYKGITKEEIGDKFNSLVDNISDSKLLSECVDSYNNFVNNLFLSNNKLSFKEAIIDQMLISNNLFFNKIGDDFPKVVEDGVKKELNILQDIANISSKDIKDMMKEIFVNDEEKQVIDELIDWNIESYKYSAKNDMNYEVIKELLVNSDSWSSCTNDIMKFHKINGTGRSTAYYAFVWERFENEEEGHLREIVEPDPISIKELIGYDSQKQEIINNTEHFLKGAPANNLLLYGSRGTGKSSTVKAILNEYYKDGLRLIEVDKEQLSDFTRIIRLLRDKKQKFIIFVDDLVFAENEASYSALKTILEGRIENRPSNILIYATTNRRHLVKEKFSDRDEVNGKDTQEEQLSLADRFGITISFFAPNQKEFLEIVDGIIKNRNLNVDIEYAHREALKWEKWNNGRSPRSARQFVDWLEGELM